jgi:hypothetical protein
VSEGVLHPQTQVVFAEHATAQLTAIEDSARCEPEPHECEQQVQHFITCTGPEIQEGTVFDNIDQAKTKCQRFSRCPLFKRSAKKGNFVYLQCFRHGTHVMKESSVEAEFQRSRETKKCGCPFRITLKRIKESQSYTVIKLHPQHNHDLFEDSELALLPQNRFIPPNVLNRMHELNSHGFLKVDQVMNLIEAEFPEVPVTWTKRDVQNRFQETINRKLETSEFVKLLQNKVSDGWSVDIQLNEETLRLERIFWISKTGKERFRSFNDVLEVDATYKTNRYFFFVLCCPC